MSNKVIWKYITITIIAYVWVMVLQITTLYLKYIISRKWENFKSNVADNFVVSIILDNNLEKIIKRIIILADK